MLYAQVTRDTIFIYLFSRTRRVQWVKISRGTFAQGCADRHQQKPRELGAWRCEAQLRHRDGSALCASTKPIRCELEADSEQDCF